MTADFATRLLATVQAHGGIAVGYVTPAAFDSGSLRERFDRWLQVPGNAGALPYLDRSLAARLDPFAAQPWAKACLVVAFPADWGRRDLAPPLPPAPAGKPAGTISLYACGPDYHTGGQRLLHRLAEALAEAAAVSGSAKETPPRFLACVDTRPVPEVFLAVVAGLGTLGRNGLLRTPQHGSRVFIGVLFTSLDLPGVPSVRLSGRGFAPDPTGDGNVLPSPHIRGARSPVPAPKVSTGPCAQFEMAIWRPERMGGLEGRLPLQPGCGGGTPISCAACGACVRNCPTGALRVDGLVEVRKCRSWLSMEWRGPLTLAQQQGLGDCLFGCDGCTAACAPALAPSAPIAVDLEWLAMTPAAEIRRRISGTALEHAGTTLLRRNALAILGQRLEPAARRELRNRVLTHSHSPVLRETVAAWEA